MQAPEPSRPPMAVVEQLLTIRDLAKLFQVSPRTIRRWCQRQLLPQPVRYGRNCVRWKASVIRQYLSNL
jgi:predicted DNA-binding transcriptional regulator AlpA